MDQQLMWGYGSQPLTLSSAYQSTAVAPSISSPNVAYVPPEPYKAPEYDEGRITDLTQTQAAGTVRGLRSSIQKVVGSRFENPNVRRMTLREALAGYGQGMQSAMSKASESARALYNTEYAGKADESKTNYSTAAQAAAARYQVESQKAMSEYQTAWNNYNAERSREMAAQELAINTELKDKQLNIMQQEADAKSKPPVTKIKTVNPWLIGTTA